MRVLPASRKARAVTAAAAAVTLAAGAVIAVSLVDGQPRGASAAVASFSQTPGWLTDPSGGPLAASAPAAYPAPTAPPVVLPTPTVPPAAVPPVIPPAVVPPVGVPPVTVPSTPPATAPAASPTPTAPAPADVVPPQDPVRLASTLFGLHVNGYGIAQAPKTTYGAIRLWDAGVTWAQLEPANDRWDWTRLDAEVAAAAKAHAPVLLVLGQTPPWAASDAVGDVYGPGAASPPKNPAEWREYVRTVATRYKGRIREYEVWNEPNTRTFWRGSAPQLVALARTAHDIVKSVDPTATVTTPSFVVRRAAQRGDFTRYLAAGGANYADVINLHLYPEADGTPETMADILTDVRARLARAGVSKPIWNTEVNYLLPTGGAAAPAPLAAPTAAAYVARTYLVTAQLGVQRAYWYAWDNPRIGVPLTSDGATPTAAGAAYTRIQNWLGGPGFRGCVVDNQGTWTCWVGAGRVVWNPALPSVNYSAPWGTRAIVALDGTSTAKRHGAVITVGGSPLLIRTS